MGGTAGVAYRRRAVRHCARRRKCPPEKRWYDVYLAVRRVLRRAMIRCRRENCPPGGTRCSPRPTRPRPFRNSGVRGSHNCRQPLCARHHKAHFGALPLRACAGGAVQILHSHFRTGKHVMWPPATQKNQHRCLTLAAVLVFAVDGFVALRRGVAPYKGVRPFHVRAGARPLWCRRGRTARQGRLRAVPLSAVCVFPCGCG